MAYQSILREYLVSLGFRVDKVAQKKFGTEIEGLDKRVMTLGKDLVGVGVAAQAMVGVFAAQMEKLYYASKLAETSAGNLRSIEFGAKQIGISGDTMRQSLVNMASAIRMNPGLVGLLNSLGVRVEGRDKSDVLVDLVTELKKMPFNIGARYAEYFGISPNDLLLMEQGLDKWKEKIALQKQIAADMGIDQEAATAAGLKYANTWGEILMRMNLAKDALSIALLPAMQEMAGVTIQVLNDWTKIIQTWRGGADFFTRMREGLTGGAKPGVQLNKEAQERIDRFQKYGFPSNSGSGRGSVNPSLPGGAGPSSEASALFSRLETQYGLPSGLLDRIWAKESARGTNMLNAKSGARGHFQFMPRTAAEYGISGQEDDLGASATAAARKMAGLLKYYKGDLSRATAAYNLGEGNLDSFLNGSGKYKSGIPAETVDYAQTIAGSAPQVNQTNNITISGVSDPQSAANEVGRQQTIVNNDLVRNLTPRVR